MILLPSRQRLVAASAAAAMLIAGCGVSSSSNEPVATISFTEGGDDIEIPADEFGDVLDDLSASDTFVELIYGGELPDDVDLGVLTQMIQVEVLLAEAEREGVAVGEDDLAAARTDLSTQITGLVANSGGTEEEADQVSEDLDQYFELIAQSIAASTALQDLYTEELAAEVDETSGVPCVSHILLESEEDALAVIAELDEGADFFDMAVEHSTGPTGPTGGDLGCADPAGYVVEFADALVDAPLNTIIGPVQTEFGFHVITVTGYDASGATDALVNEKFIAVFDNTVVVVDPDLGVWNPTLQSVVPPGE